MNCQRKSERDVYAIPERINYGSNSMQSQEPISKRFERLRDIYPHLVVLEVLFKMNLGFKISESEFPTLPPFNTHFSTAIIKQRSNSLAVSMQLYKPTIGL